MALSLVISAKFLAVTLSGFCHEALRASIRVENNVMATFAERVPQPVVSNSMFVDFPSSRCKGRASL